MQELGYKLYLVFITSWFLHLTSRISILGVLRFDFLLIAVMVGMIIYQGNVTENKYFQSNTAKILLLIIIYVLITLPFVEWPGSVIKKGIPEFIKAIVFYFFTISFIDTEKKLKVFILVFLACLSFRVFEPLYLHLTEGYWGSAAYAQGDFMNRLAGAPHDVINPNGLAAIIDSTIPFLYFFAPFSWLYTLLFACAMPPFLYALVLTGSRSGLVGLMAIVIGCIIKSKHKALLTAIVCICGIIFFVNLSAEHQDRYVSIVDPNVRHSATSHARIEGIIDSFEVALRRPVFGHGLGTSAEANFNFSGEYKIAHNLYAEVTQELGLVGLLIYLFFLKTIIVNFIHSNKVLQESVDEGSFLKRFNDAMQVWLFMNVLFSLASFGLSSYIWYLFGGLSIVMVRLSSQVHEHGDETVDTGSES